MSIITFIINPTSGTGKAKKIPALVRSYFFKSTQHHYRIRYTEYAGHAKLIVNEEIAKGAEIIVAVGGDGTVNEIASTLRRSKTALGIIPAGSGNGLARHLKIPMNARKALKLISEGNPMTIDTGEVNGDPFFCTAGIGFDATVAERFSQVKGRGLITYIKASLGEYQKYNPVKVLDQYRNVHQGFLITVCNANQYGNNAFIAPQANIKDGFLDLVEVAPVSLFQLPNFVRKLFNQTINTLPIYSSSQFKEIVLKREKPGPLHLDGDPFPAVAELRIRCIPKSLSVIAKGNS